VIDASHVTTHHNCITGRVSTFIWSPFLFIWSPYTCPVPHVTPPPTHCQINNLYIRFHDALLHLHIPVQCYFEWLKLYIGAITYSPWVWDSLKKCSVVAHRGSRVKLILNPWSVIAIVTSFLDLSGHLHVSILHI